MICAWPSGGGMAASFAFTYGRFDQPSTQKCLLCMLVFEIWEVGIPLCKRKAHISWAWKGLLVTQIPTANCKANKSGQNKANLWHWHFQKLALPSHSGYPTALKGPRRSLATVSLYLKSGLQNLTLSVMVVHRWYVSHVSQCGRIGLDPQTEIYFFLLQYVQIPPPPNLFQIY